MSNSQLAPICIASPLRRSGTTLLQRLLCSASNAIIYGEDCANDFNLFQNLLLHKKLLLQNNSAWHKQQLSSVLQGNLNAWIPNLMPNIEGYLETHQKAIFSIFQYYADFAQQQQRPIWGMKLPEWNPSALLQLQRLLPAAKIIYLHRNIEACVRSAKRIDMVNGLEEIKQFCSTGQQFSTYARQNLAGQNVLHLDYLNMVENPALTIRKLETFTGAKNINPSVLNIKINTYENGPKLTSEEKDSYLIPAELNAEELSIVKQFQLK